MGHESYSQRLRPTLVGEFWLIGPTPGIPGRVPSDCAMNGPECVDHHIFQGMDGEWHLWGCIRGLATGRILYHWQGECLEQGPWRLTGESMRPERIAGESIADWEGREWIQSPFVIQASGTFYFFFGGHSTGRDAQGQEVIPGDPSVECQICLMTSKDGLAWQRYRNEYGQSRLFSGPGEARDPCVIRINDRWHLYYAGYASGDPLQPGIYLRTSTDLVHWTEPKLVHRDNGFGIGRWTHECPCVVQRGNYFYMFRTQDYDRARTHVYWSDDPWDFGIDRSAPEKYIGLLPVSAPEVIADGKGGEYLTSCHDMRNGIQICRLGWTID